MSLFGGRRGDASSPPGDRDHSQLPEPSTTPRNQSQPSGRAAMANIGKSISIKGDLTGNEDIAIEGTVEGKVDLPNGQLTIGANGTVKGEVHAKGVVVIGRVTGNVNGSERVEIQASGVVQGDVFAPKLVVAEGAQINGSIRMGKPGALQQPSQEARKVAG